MIVTILKHLITLTLGLVIGYFIFDESEKRESNESLVDFPLLAQSADNKSVNTPSITVAPVKNTRTDNRQEDTKSNLSVSGESFNQKTVTKLQQVIAKQQSEIERLNAELKSIQENPSKESAGLETISMDDFESQVKDQFMNRFKGIAIKVSGEQLEGIKKEFEKVQDKANWNATYENNITDFIQQSDPNGFHFVDELTCNKNMCRLAVNSSDTSSWQKLYLSMTEQDWYRSMTLTEESDTPNRLIYYITQPSITREQ